MTTFTWPACSVPTAPTAGEIIRHGPHHGAQKSTKTGTEAGTLRIQAVGVGVDDPRQEVVAVPADLVPVAVTSGRRALELLPLARPLDLDASRLERLRLGDAQAEDAVGQ